MDLIYWLIILAAFFSELSCKVNTESLIKKGALTLIIVGCWLELADRPNHLIYLGVLGYFTINIAISYFFREKRRLRDA
jgi:hypothetical protein